MGKGVRIILAVLIGAVAVSIGAGAVMAGLGAMSGGEGEVIQVVAEGGDVIRVIETRPAFWFPFPLFFFGFLFVAFLARGLAFGRRGRRAWADGRSGGCGPGGGRDHRHGDERGTTDHVHDDTDLDRSSASAGLGAPGTMGQAGPGRPTPTDDLS